MVEHPLRRQARLVVAVLCIAFAAPVCAQTYYYCYVKDYYGSEGLYYTPIMAAAVERIDETQTGFAFSAYLSEQGRLPEIGSGSFPLK